MFVFWLLLLVWIDLNVQNMSECDDSTAYESTSAKFLEFLPLITVTTDTLQASLASQHINSYFVTLFSSFNIFSRVEFIIYLDTLYSNRSRKVFRKSFMNAKRRSTVNCWWYLQLQPLIEERLCTMSSLSWYLQDLAISQGPRLSVTVMTTDRVISLILQR